MNFQICSRILFAGIVLILANLAMVAQTPNWAMQNSGTTAGLRGIFSVDGKVAWASGTEGTVLRTVDGGAHWTKCAVPDAATDGATLDFRGVQAWDAMTAIVMASGPGEKSRLYRTSDGCKSWASLFKNPDTPDGFFDSFWIGEHGEGMLLGDPVHGRFAFFWTLDKGARWQRDLSEDLDVGAANLGAFAASNASILHGQNASRPQRLAQLFAAGGKDGSFVYSASNTCTMTIVQQQPDKCAAFSHWQRTAVPLPSGAESTGIFALASRQNFNDPMHLTLEQKRAGFRRVILAVGGDYVKPNESAGTAAWSEDDGKSWHIAATPPHGYRSSVSWSEELKAWIAVGTNGSDVSRDDGKTWQPIDDGNWNALSLPFVVGPKGRIARIAVTSAK